MHYCVKMLNKVNEYFSLFGVEGSYYEKIMALKGYDGEVPENLRKELLEFVEELNPQKLKTNIVKILNPNILEVDITEELLNNATLAQLSTKQLFNYFWAVIHGVTFTQEDKYVLMKYGMAIFNTGWSKLTLLSRGIVIDTEKNCVASYPFDKFFNINEEDGWRDQEVIKAIKQSKEVVMTDKKDGSLIAVTNYHGEILITSNGSFHSDQVGWAIELLQKYYQKFYSNIPEGYTFIFELIYPLNRTNLVVDYGDMEKLYLLDVRDLNTNRFWSYSQMCSFAKEYKLDVTESESFEDLYDVIRKANSLKNANKEGWVLRISNEEKDLFVKIKLAEYFILHKAQSTLNLKRVYNLYVSGDIEKFLETSPEDVSEAAKSMIEEININKNAYIEMQMEELPKALRVLGFSREEALSNKANLLEFIKVFGTGHLLMALKGEAVLKHNIQRLSFKNYEKMLSVLEGES